MAVQTVPAYLQNASHSAAVFRQAISAPFSASGVLAPGELNTAAQSTPNMSVQVSAGRGQVKGSNVSPPAGFTFTTQGMYNVLNDAPVSLTITTSNPTNPRIDAVYIQVQDAFYVGASNTVILGVVAGTPAATPVAPSIPSTAMLLSYVAVGAGATSIVNGNITSQTVLAQVIGAARTDTATAFVGTTPPAGAQIITKYAAVKLNLNSSGDTSYNYPAPFPNGIVFAQVGRWDFTGYGPTFQMIYDPTSSPFTSLAAISWRTYTAANVPLVSVTNVPFMIQAIGW